jgi:hypothetical protein
MHHFKRNTNALMHISVGGLSLSWTVLLTIAFIQETDLLALIAWDPDEVFIQDYYFSGSCSIKMVVVNWRGQGRVIVVSF